MICVRVHARARASVETSIKKITKTVSVRRVVENRVIYREKFGARPTGTLIEKTRKLFLKDHVVVVYLVELLYSALYVVREK